MEFAESDINRKSLRFSFLDGVFASVMIGITQDYFTPFLLFLGGTSFQVGLLSAFPNMVASLAQLRTAEFIRMLRSRKRTITSFVFLQALMIGAIAFVALGGWSSVTIFISLAVLFTTFGAIATPAWGSLMSDIVAGDRRGAYFGWRNSLLGCIVVMASFGAGILLHWIEPGRLREGFFALFAAACVTRVASWYFLTRMHDPEPAHHRGARFDPLTFFEKLRSSNFARFVMFVSLMSFSVSMAAPFFAVLMIRDLRFNYLEYSVITATAPLVMYLMMGRWGRLADRIGNVRVLKFTAPIIAGVPLLWIAGRHPVYLFFAQVISGFAWSGFQLAASNFIFDAVAPDRRVKYISYFNVLNGVLLSLGALLGGSLLSWLPGLLGLPILTLFAISSGLRIVVSTALPVGLKEVRAVDAIRGNELIFSLIGMRPMGIERKNNGGKGQGG
ncbi:MAG: MFS transporter [Spirochaetes bacterium]|nr:MAG: MFS transporter [Spirochaetota bacterium]